MLLSIKRPLLDEKDTSVTYSVFKIFEKLVGHVPKSELAIQALLLTLEPYDNRELEISKICDFLSSLLGLSNYLDQHQGMKIVHRLKHCKFNPNNQKHWKLVGRKQRKSLPAKPSEKLLVSSIRLGDKRLHESNFTIEPSANFESALEPAPKDFLRETCVEFGGLKALSAVYGAAA
eukprot:CAMPEP_0174257036 /NCGR_PEP_ID=MMETSP0439-20130205/6213_1 /TAXON_ID=0 /ORGANISM="Stereomyxa ramosa, Strain Chinc5" /LENGTH=175 /DNA_ID=CAMNT_0015339939 /DNA_START=433 /DNA_END=956 /DNA_ORIENTATION=-